MLKNDLIVGVRRSSKSYVLDMIGEELLKEGIDNYLLEFD